MKVEDEIYGVFTLPEHIGKLLETKAIQRLKGVRQNGADSFIEPKRNATRYEHSVGVMLLLRRLGASEEEQIAGLFHDVSHTAFSHLVDTALGNAAHDYHEQVKESFLKKECIPAQLEKLGFDPEKIFDEDRWPLLEQPLPHLCADRIDYCLRDLFKAGRISREEVKRILDTLVVDEGRMKCHDLEGARLLFDKFLELNRELFFDPLFEAANLYLGELIKRLLAKGELTEQELLKEDRFLLERIEEKDAALLEGLTPELEFSKGGAFLIKRKLRAIDPEVTGKGCLTELDPKAKAALEAFLQLPTEVSYALPFLEKRLG